MTNQVIQNPAPPNLPLAPDQYERRFFDQHSNVLRLYFNRLQNALTTLFNRLGGRFLNFPYVAASDTQVQYADASNTPTIIKWNTLNAGNGFTLNPDSTATAQAPGLYKITYSLQFANDDNVAHDAIVWLRINDSTPAYDVAGSTTIFTLPARKSTGVPSFVCGYSEVVFPLRAGDSVGLWWGTDGAASSGGATGVYIAYQAAQTSPMTYPETPSALGSITFVSSLPS